MNKYSDIFYKLEKSIRFNNEIQKFVLDIKDPKYSEIIEYFRFDNLQQARMALKIWLKELESLNIENEDEEDAIIEFFKIRFFMDNPLDIKKRRAGETQLEE